MVGRRAVSGRANTGRLRSVGEKQEEARKKMHGNYSVRTMTIVNVSDDNETKQIDSEQHQE